MLGASLALSTLLCFPACDGDDGQAAITREDYILTYVEILLAADQAPDSFAASDSARAILARRGLTEEDLLGYARQYAEDPSHLALAWQEIHDRIRNPEDFEEDTTGDGEVGSANRVREQ